jgi:hypothetical protein
LSREQDGTSWLFPHLSLVCLVEKIVGVIPQHQLVIVGNPFVDRNGRIYLESGKAFWHIHIQPNIGVSNGSNNHKCWIYQQGRAR